MVLHPLVAYRDCEHCKKWLYDEKTGKVIQRRGQDVPRGDVPTPCDLKLVGCKKGHYDDTKTFIPRNQMAYRHYQECEAVGRFPDDGMVRHNARVIRETKETLERIERHRQVSALGAILGMGGVRHG